MANKVNEINNKLTSEDYVHSLIQNDNDVKNLIEAATKKAAISFSVTANFSDISIPLSGEYLYELGNSLFQFGPILKAQIYQKPK